MDSSQEDPEVSLAQRALTNPRCHIHTKEYRCASYLFPLSSTFTPLYSVCDLSGTLQTEIHRFLCQLASFEVLLLGDTRGRVAKRASLWFTSISINGSTARLVQSLVSANTFPTPALSSQVLLIPALPFHPLMDESRSRTHR